MTPKPLHLAETLKPSFHLASTLQKISFVNRLKSSTCVTLLKKLTGVDDIYSNAIWKIYDFLIFFKGSKF
jgi:hypothetical protein